MATLQDAIAYVQDLVGGLSGINAAPDYPPEALNVFPFAAAFAGTGIWQGGPAGMKKGLHNIRLQLHVARKDLAHDIQAAMVYSDSIPNVLMNNPTLGGTVSTIGTISYRFGPMGWNGVETIGWDFTIENVKMESAIT